MPRTSTVHVAISAAALVVAAGLAAPAAAASADVPACAPAKPHAAGAAQIDVAVEDGLRQAMLHVPASYTGKARVPLVLDLHASGISPELELGITGIDAAADVHGFIVALPVAVTPFDKGGKTWNVPHSEAWLDDVAFVAALLDRLEETLCIDPGRIYATGFSGGARLASELACRLPERIAAISVVGGLRLPDEEKDHCAPDGPAVAVLAFHAEDDPINPYDGDPAVSPAYWSYGIDEALARWTRRLACAGEGSVTALSDTVDRMAWADCQDGGALALYRLHGSGHTWPGSSFPFPDYLGAVEPSLDATALTLDWFERHARRPH